MRSFSKYFLTGFQINPINRDLLLVVAVGAVIAVAIITLMMMIISNI